MKTNFVELGKGQFGLLTKPILTGIVETALDAFGSGMDEKEVLEHIYPADRLYLAHESGVVVGFATAKLKQDAVYLAGAGVREDAQGNGIHQSFTQRRINFGLEHKKSKVEFRTQNPKIELSVRKSLDGLVRVGLISGFSLKRELLHRVYGRMLTEMRPFCDVEEIDGAFDVLDYDVGDTFYIKVGLER